MELRRDALLRKLISIEELTDAWGEIVRSVRQLAVSIPARCQEAMPHLRFEDFETFRKIVREVLTEPRRSRPTTRQSLQAAKRTISRQSSNANEGVRQDPARSSVADFETERKGEQFLLKPSYRYADARRLNPPVLWPLGRAETVMSGGSQIRPASCGREPGSQFFINSQCHHSYPSCRCINKSYVDES